MRRVSINPRSIRQAAKSNLLGDRANPA